MSDVRQSKALRSLDRPALNFNRNMCEKHKLGKLPIINLKPSCFFRYVLGYKGNARQQCVQSRGHRASGIKVVHVVTASCSTLQLQSLLNDRLLPLCPSGDTEIQVSTTWIVAVPQSKHQQNLLPALNLILSCHGMLFIVYFYCRFCGIKIKSVAIFSIIFSTYAGFTV